MVSLERTIYTIAYYWHGISKRAVHIVMWLFDSLYQLELLQWSTINGLPYNQTLEDQINDMIVNGSLRVTNGWLARFSNQGLEPVQTQNSVRIYKSSDKFSENFRMVTKYFMTNIDKFKTFYLQHEGKFISQDRFNEYVNTVKTQTR